MTSASPAASSRVPVIDHLRTLIIIQVVFFHAALAYVAFPIRWYFHDSQRWIVFDGLQLIGDALILPVLFFLGGFVTPGSLARKGARKFLRDRLARLGLPFLAVLLVAGPFPGWIAQLDDGGTLSYLAFWPSFFRLDMSHAHLWFLPHLLLLCASAALVSALRPASFAAALATPRRPPSWQVFVGLALAVVLATSLTNGVPGERWIDFALLNVQPSHVPTNVAAYCLGLAASLGGWLDAPAGRRALWRRALVAIALGTAYVAAAAFGHPATHPPMQPLYLGLRCVFSVALLALVLELAALLRDRRLPLGRALSPLSYSLYLLHLVPVLALGLALRDWPVHPVLKVVLVTLGALVSSWLAGAALLRTPARRLLGG